MNKLVTHTHIKTIESVIHSYEPTVIILYKVDLWTNKHASQTNSDYAHRSSSAAARTEVSDGGW